VRLLINFVTTSKVDSGFNSLSVSVQGEDLIFDHGRTYFINDRRLDKSMDILQDFIYSGYRALVISRFFPDLLKEKWPDKDVTYMWLSERVTEESVSPSQLNRMIGTVCRFLEEEGEAVVFIDGIEYLSVFNDFQRIQMFVEEMNDSVMEHRGIMLIPLDPRPFDPRSLARLRRFAEIVE